LAKTGGKSEALCREEGERGIRGGFALSVASGILSRPIELWTARRGQLTTSICICLFFASPVFFSTKCLVLFSSMGFVYNP
jgi:hypothetical protein